jgi:DNA-binding NarL/FixJ family response regulator
MSQRTLRALVVDDHPLMATAVSTALNATRRFQEIETASSLLEAVQCLEKNPAFSLAVLDMHLADTDGRESLLRMRESFPDVPILVFSANDSLDHITMAFECGARGYVTKSSPMSVLNHAIELVLEGSSYVPPQAVSLLGFPAPAERAPARTGAPQLNLSGRQQQVFRLLLQGMPNKVIASRLSMAEGTAKAHLNTVFRVLGVRTRVEAILRARELGLI